MKPIGIIDQFCDHKWMVIKTSKQEPKGGSADMDRTPVNNNLPTTIRYYQCDNCGSTAKSIEKEITFPKS